MSLDFDAPPVPLRRDEHGTIRVGESRVTLDSVIGLFNQGSSAEQIAHSFDTLDLADIYAVISYYLRHHEEVDAYLAEQKRIGDEHRRHFESRFDPRGVRDRLLARKRLMDEERKAQQRGA